MNDYGIKRSTISIPAREMISDIIKKIEHAVKSYTHFTIKYIGTFSEVKKGIHYENILKDMKDDIENLPKMGRQFSFSIGSRIFNIFFIKPCKEKASSTMDKDFDKYCKKNIKKIYIWLFAICQYANNECSQNLNIYIYLTDHKKKLPETIHEPLEEIHANSAFTMACPIVSNEINIFREEEWFKVFIHETFHSFGMDFARMDEKETNTKMFSIFPVITNGIRFYEAYTEFWAEVINIIMISVNSHPCNKGHLDMEIVFENIRSHLYDEQVFSMFQCTKVLRHFGLQYRELYDSGKHAAHKRNSRYREKTYIFSYYILKCIMMYYYNDFIKLCYKNNNKSIQFTKTQSNIDSFIYFIKQRYNSHEFLRTIHIFEDAELHTLFGNDEKRNEKTMRMSITE